MKRVSITLYDDIAAGLECYLDSQEARPSVTAVIQTALRRFLAAKGYLRPAPHLSDVREGHKASLHAEQYNRGDISDAHQLPDAFSRDLTTRAWSEANGSVRLPGCLTHRGRTVTSEAKSHRGRIHGNIRKVVRDEHH